MVGLAGFSVGAGWRCWSAYADGNAPKCPRASLLDLMARRSRCTGAGTERQQRHRQELRRQLPEPRRLLVRRAAQVVAWPPTLVASHTRQHGALSQSRCSHWPRCQERSSFPDPRARARLASPQAKPRQVTKFRQRPSALAAWALCVTAAQAGTQATAPNPHQPEPKDAPASQKEVVEGTREPPSVRAKEFNAGVLGPVPLAEMPLLGQRDHARADRQAAGRLRR